MLDFSRYRLAILRVGYAFMLLNRRRYLTKSRGKCLINELIAKLNLTTGHFTAGTNRAPTTRY